MASDTDSTSSDEPGLSLSWSRRWSLGHRILAVNVLTLILLALSVLYLDVFRNRLSKERTRQTRMEATMTAQAMAHVPQSSWPGLLASVSRSSESRMRVFGPDGRLVLDSWRATGPTYELRDPNTQKWTKDVARALDRGFNALVGADPLDDFIEPGVDRLQAWPEALRARRSREPETAVRNAPDMTPVLSAAVAVGPNVLLVTDNDRAFTRTVRRQRAALAATMTFLIVLSALLSIFLARTIV
jgi:two-component system sensor histidine kinase ChvG